MGARSPPLPGSARAPNKYGPYNRVPVPAQEIAQSRLMPERRADLGFVADQINDGGASPSVNSNAKPRATPRR